MSDNPYSAPVLESPVFKDKTEADPNSLLVIAKQTFLAWERLRLIYIGSLGLFTVILCGSNMLRVEVIALVIAGAIVSNVCYFAGPVIETYVRWLGYRGSWVRWSMFLSGTLFTSILAAVQLIPMVLPNQK